MNESRKNSYGEELTFDLSEIHGEESAISTTILKQQTALYHAIDTGLVLLIFELKRSDGLLINSKIFLNLIK